LNVNLKIKTKHDEQVSQLPIPEKKKTLNELKFQNTEQQFFKILNKT